MLAKRSGAVPVFPANMYGLPRAEYFSEISRPRVPHFLTSVTGATIVYYKGTVCSLFPSTRHVIGL